MKPGISIRENLGHHLNVIGVLGISLILLIAFYYQLFFYDLPCPLCLLQRAGLMLVGLAMMLNVRFGEKGQYYAMALLGAVCTGAIAARQVLLHILPGSGSYGSVLFGLHFYTWALLAALGIILYVAVMLVFFGRFVEVVKRPELSKVSSLILLLFTILIAANLVFVLLECGRGQCDQNPALYNWMVGLL